MKVPSLKGTLFKNAVEAMGGRGVLSLSLCSDERCVT